MPKDHSLTANDALDRGALLIALSGYAILIVVTLTALLLPGVRNRLGQVSVQLQFPELRTSLDYITPATAGRRISIFGHTGMLLFYSSVVAYMVYRLAGCYRTGSVHRIIDGTLRRVMPSTVSIVSMVSMASIMEHAGMTEALARGMAQSVGQFYPFIAPWIGAIGAFMTGSNTNSNVVFAMLQMRTAELLGNPVVIILAGQTAGAALASVVAPSKVVVGTSTAGMAGREGDVMRRLLPYIALLVLLMSVLTVLGVWLSG